MLADKAYDADRIRTSLRKKGAFGNIPPEVNQRSKPYFSTWLYRERNLIEHFFSKLKHFRRVATPLRQFGRKLPRHRPSGLNAAVASCL